MKHSILLPVIVTFILVTLSSHAQVSKAADKINQTNASVNAAANSATQTASTVKNVLSIFNGAKKEKKDNKVLIIISGLDYGDDNLLQLENAFEAINGVKKVTKILKDGVITIEVKYKDGADKLWKGVPANLQKLFKTLQAEEKSMVLEYRNNETIEKANPVTEVKSKPVHSTASKKDDVVDFIEFKIDGKLIHIDKKDPLWQSIYTQMDNESANPKFFKALGMKTGFTGGGTFSLVLMDISNSVVPEKTYSIKAGSPIQPLILAFSYTSSEHIEYTTTIKESEQNFRTDGNLVLTRFENIEGGIAEGTFNFSNIALKDFKGKVITENHKLTDGRFKLTVNKLMPVY
jgi:hypothetical protein